MSSTTDRTSSEASAGSSLVVSKSFDRVLDSLSDQDRYNAVLQGLAGIAVSSSGKDRFVELLKLLDEMADRNIGCTTRSGGAVVDAAASTAEVAKVATAMSKLRRTGAAQKFSRELTRLAPLPLDERRRARALKDLVPTPSDDRGGDLMHAGAFLGVVGFDFAGDGLAPVLDFDATVPAILSLATAGAVALDIFQGGAERSRRVLAGLSRLFTRDVSRESRAEAGAFLAGYLTGLPCFAFKPNVLEALRMVEGMPELKEAFQSGGAGGAHRTLVWLLSAVAGEHLTHRQLIVSDPRQATTFLLLARERGLLPSCGDAAADAEDDEMAVRWAFNEARELLRDNEGMFEALRQRLETGGATVGECVSLIDRYRG
ncbi:hypothetical protein JKP88DRAFT_354141 [Tribonema minus]|uniref:Uncharacterized protein n=1 Tax=Tribonema minus TaxID=303371 RepID=A0A835Z355_9STRA|nr:hypothetical protein JKP88DRAFT_354141 [Tribonema minus]